jgi:hypothetical protein
MCQPAVADQHEIICGQDTPSVVIQQPECHKSRFGGPGWCGRVVHRRGCRSGD